MISRHWLVVLTAVSGWALCACDVTGPPEGYVFFKVRFQGDVGMIVGANTYVTRDGGRSWQRRAFGGRLRMEDVVWRYQNQIQLLADGTIVHSFSDALMRVRPDGSIASSNELPGAPFQFRFRDAKIAVGFERGTEGVLRTTDGGASWERTLQSPDELDMVATVWLADDEVYLLTYPWLRHSLDAGKSWKAVSEFGTSSGMEYFGGKLGIWNGGYVAIYEPIASRASTSQKFETTGVADIHSRDSTIFVLGNDGRFFWGNSDRGWEEALIPIDPWKVQLLSFDFAPDGSLWVVGGQRSDFGTGSRVVWTSSDLKKWRRVDFSW